jgi:ATP-binding cassette, subfamily F, member 3
MSLLFAQNLSKSFGPDDIFSAISLSIPNKARIAIVGPNGIGKTTLLRILVGQEEPTSGSVQKTSKIKIGYLPQEAVLTATHTLWDECLKAMADLLELEEKLSKLELAMADPDQVDQAIERYGRLQEEFERRGGYMYETRIQQTLTGLGFSERDYHRPIPQLSGGQRTRALLARLLLSDPNLLVLDEPTNHLDIEAVEWLEGYLSQWEGAALIVSHDRYFLDRVADHIWEMKGIGLEIYHGNYSAYLQQRQERWELSQNIYESEKSRLLKELDYIKRNIAGQNTRQAKGKLRRLSREIQAIEQLGFNVLQSNTWSQISQDIEISSHPLGVAELEHRIRSLHRPSERPLNLSLQLKTDTRSGDLVLRTKDLEIGYADEGKPLFLSPDLILRRGECAAVIGPNGAGKTTFLKTLLGQIDPLNGEVNLGASLKIGYFAQAHEDLQPENNLVQEIQIVAPNILVHEIRDYLARFLFRGEDVYKQVSTLSGGERGRLALAKLSLAKANLLLLDEPSNHLDIPSQEILQEVLFHYQGTILLVSHDRYLIDALGTQIWEIDPHKSILEVFEGTYTQYHEFLESQENLEKPKQDNNQQGQSIKNPKKTNFNEHQIKIRREDIEKQIAKLENDLAILGKQLENPPSDTKEIQNLGHAYMQTQNTLDTLIHEWDQLTD